MVGREKEAKELNDIYNQNSAEFIAVYGRRRVGKTYLIDEVFSGRITFRHAGLSPIESNDGRPLKIQLKAFYYSLLRQGFKKSHCPKDWQEAFFMLEEFLQEKDDGTRQLVFLDEMPWMDTPKSGFITALEGFWNGWGCHRKNLMLIVCGSANSWIINKLVNNHGGLYNRITHEIKLKPFTLKECEECLENRNIQFSRYDIVQTYMILGGIPFYLNYLQRDKSLVQNVDSLFFSKNAVLANEYNRLFASVFNNPETTKSIVELLAKKSIGFTRKEICENIDIYNGGQLSELLESLIASDFVEKYVPFGYKKSQEHYKLIDPFCLFYIKIVKNNNMDSENFYADNINSQSVSSLRGFAFENVCFNHIAQIKNALGIRGISSKQSAWSEKTDTDKGTQIDLIIVRNDNVVNMCEMKFYSDEFEVNKEYDLLLHHRQKLLSEKLSKKQVVFNTLITTYGLKSNKYFGDFTSVITLDDLFS